VIEVREGHLHWRVSMLEVELVSLGYYWECHFCGMNNFEAEVKKEVTCVVCKNTYPVKEKVKPNDYPI
jgi:hypothetical protein